MRLWLKILLFCLFQVVWLVPTKATHIVGGEMTYRCLGNNLFEVRLQVFRDCYYGVPWFDTLGSVGVFDVAGNLLDSVKLVPYDNVFLVNPTLDPCLQVPTDVCVETVTYTDTFELPFLAGGYILSYQRCCRNLSISNIVEPGSVGATYMIHITPEALNECNNSPVFNAWPPTFVCVGKPITFNHFANDVDGDSISYRLCTPLDGGTPNAPIPQPPNPPPYLEIAFQAPLYSLENMLGSVLPLQINVNTGQLSGVPDLIGQFVIGVCADEFRDGVYLSTIRRDFQYNVRPCGPAFASIATDSVICNALTASISSFGSFADSVQWYLFDSEGNLLADTTAQDFEYTFPFFGTFTQMLIINPGSICADTAYAEVRCDITPPVSQPLLSPIECSNGIIVQLVSLPSQIFTEPSIASWQFYAYDPDFNLVYDTISGDSFQIIVNQDGQYLYYLDVTFSNGCKIVPISFRTYDIIENQPLDSISTCGFDTIYLHPAGVYDSTETYIWQPVSEVSNDTLYNPYIVFSDASQGFYPVQITNLEGCILQDTVFIIETSPDFEISTSVNDPSCDYPITFSITGNYELGSSFWSLDPAFQSAIAFGPVFELVAPLDQTIYVQALSQYGCLDTDSIQPVSLENISTDLLFVPPTCANDSVIQIIADVASDLPYTITWAPENIYTSINPNTAIFQLQDTGFVATATIINAIGCESAAAQYFQAKQDYTLDVNILASATTIDFGDTIALSYQASGVFNNPLIAEWGPDSLFSNPNADSQTTTPFSSTTYTLLLTDANGCQATDALTVSVNVNGLCEEPYVFLPNAFSPNGDTHNDTWTLYGKQYITNCEIRVYDRWGTLVFSSNNIDFEWNGTFQGQALPPNAYAYVLRFDCLNGQAFFKKGNVSLLR